MTLTDEELAAYKEAAAYIDGSKSGTRYKILLGAIDRLTKPVEPTDDDVLTFDICALSAMIEVEIQKHPRTGDNVPKRGAVHKLIRDFLVKHTINGEPSTAPVPDADIERILKVWDRGKYLPGEDVKALVEAFRKLRASAAPDAEVADSEIAEIIKDPFAVHINILRGAIAYRRDLALHYAGANDYDALQEEVRKLRAAAAPVVTKDRLTAEIEKWATATPALRPWGMLSDALLASGLMGGVPDWRPNGRIPVRNDAGNRPYQLSKEDGDVVSKVMAEKMTQEECDLFDRIFSDYGIQYWEIPAPPPAAHKGAE